LGGYAKGGDEYEQEFAHVMSHSTLGRSCFFSNIGWQVEASLGHAFKDLGMDCAAPRHYSSSVYRNSMAGQTISQRRQAEVGSLRSSGQDVVECDYSPGDQKSLNFTPVK
jgi:hypothetical protein